MSPNWTPATGRARRATRAKSDLVGRNLPAHLRCEIVGECASTCVASVDFVPVRNLTLTPLPAEVHRSVLIPSRKVDQAVLEAALRESDTMHENPLFDKTVNPLDGPTHRCALGKELVAVRITRLSERRSPECVQYLYAVHPELELLPQRIDLVKRLRKAGNECPSLGDGEEPLTHSSLVSSEFEGDRDAARSAETTIPRTSAEVKPRFSISLSPAIVQPLGVVTLSISTSG